MQPDQRELTFSDVFGILFAVWRVILVLAVLGAAAGYALAYFSPRIYRAQILMSPASPDAGASSSLSRLAERIAPLAGVSGSLNGTSGLANKEVWIATLRSRQLTDSFIRDSALMPALFPKRWDAAQGRWKLRDNGKPMTPTLEEAFDLFDTRVRGMSEDRRTGLVTLSIEWPDRTLVAKWANSLVALANDSIRKRNIDEARRSIAFLEGELGKTNVVERQQIIYRLIESKTSEIMMASARQEYAFIIVDPAVEPGSTNFVRPRRMVMIGIGVLLGVLAGVVYGSVVWFVRARVRAA